MKFVKKFIFNLNFLPLIIVLAFALLAGRDLLKPGYFNMHDDLQMMRQLEMEKCFLDKQIPCRWIPDMGYGFGFPLFNFYPPLPYLIGQVIRLVGFSFVDTVKVVFLLSFLVSGVGMYLLAKEFFGKWGGVVSSIFYIWAPYHSVDIYVRGAMNEAWALAWFPFILWTSYKLILEKKKLTGWMIGLSLFWFALFTSHNLMVLIFTPVFTVWCLLFLWQKKAWKKTGDLLKSGVLSLGLAAFFTIPAVLEQKYVQVSTLIVGYYEYIAHFVSLNQLLISRFWGWGPSIWGENDGMPFQIGHLHWILSLLVLGLIISLVLKKSNFKPLTHNSLFIVLFFVFVGWLALFMAHSRSTFLWKLIPQLKFVQFPWRFLTLSTLSFSFLAGSIFLLLPQKVAKVLSFVLVGGLLFLNWNYFRTEKMGPLSDSQKFSAAAWELQQTAGIYDYLPKDAITAPKEPMKNLAEIMQGKGLVTEPKLGTNWASFNIKTETDNSLIRLGIFKFPDWKVFIDSNQTNIFIDKNEQWGRMYIEIPKGEHKVYLKLFNTPIRTVSNIISLTAWLGLISFPLWRKRINAKIL